MRMVIGYFGLTMPVIALFSILLLISGCIVTKTSGFYVGYNQLTDIEKQEVEILDKDSGICNLENKAKVYAINGKQLRDCLENNDTSLVYLWGCSLPCRMYNKTSVNITPVSHHFSILDYQKC